jgi:GMP synthase (glutamine-hydrolysing)
MTDRDRLPVLVLQHMHIDGPAFLATWLAGQGATMDLRNTEAGDPYPERIDGYRALAILGGEMSANDGLPSLRQAEHLIRDAVAQGVPVLGHCLGAQLMARALGGSVVRALAPEIGWHAIALTAAPEAKAWFGDAALPEVFQWHGEAFTLPPGAVGLAHSPVCAHQAFALGPHLGLQFHVELDAEKLQRWASDRDAQTPLEPTSPTVQDGDGMRLASAERLARQQRLAAHFYARWLDGPLAG